MKMAGDSLCAEMLVPVHLGFVESFMYAGL